MLLIFQWIIFLFLTHQNQYKPKLPIKIWLQIKHVEQTKCLGVYKIFWGYKFEIYLWNTILSKENCLPDCLFFKLNILQLEFTTISSFFLYFNGQQVTRICKLFSDYKSSYPDIITKVTATLQIKVGGLPVHRLRLQCQ